jgi:hypothetical protein
LFDVFSRFVQERSLGPINVVQCEIVNVNIVPVEQFGRSFADAGAVFRGAVASEPIDFIAVESYVLNTQHLILDGDDPLGRLFSSLKPVIRVEDGQHAYRYELTARGAPIGPGLDGSLRFFEVARNAINSTFLAATTDTAHSMWGKSDGQRTSH